MAGREFERFHLDINITARDQRPVEQLQIHSAPMAFADVPAAHLTVPAITLAQQLAEKLHAYLRGYRPAASTSSRAKDAFDTVAAARLVAMPPSNELRAACKATFHHRGDTLPNDLEDLPNDWDEPLTRLLTNCPIAIADNVTDLRHRFTAFWQPLLHPRPAQRRRFDAHTWTWQSP